MALRTVSLLALGLMGFAASPTDFNPLMSVVRETWPERNHIGVVCNYEKSKEDVDKLAAVAGSQSVITVLDVRTSDSANLAVTLLRQRKADFLVLMPNDPNYGEGSFQGTRVVGGLAKAGIPSVGTGPLSIQQGAVFAIGAFSKGELLVTDKLRGTVSVILPDKVTFSRAGASTASASGAKIEVLGLN